MSAARRAARRERQAAELLGTKRVYRKRYQSAPDVEPVMLPGGERLSVEVKTRAALPALVTRALAQAAGYGARGDVPAAVLSATGAEPVIVLPLRAFRRIAGIEPAPAAPLFDGTAQRRDDVDTGRASAPDAPLRRRTDEDASTRHTSAGDGHPAEGTQLARAGGSRSALSRETGGRHDQT